MFVCLDEKDNNTEKNGSSSLSGYIKFNDLTFDRAAVAGGLAKVCGTFVRKDYRKW